MELKLSIAYTSGTQENQSASKKEVNCYSEECRELWTKEELFQIARKAQNR